MPECLIAHLLRCPALCNTKAVLVLIRVLSMVCGTRYAARLALLVLSITAVMAQSPAFAPAATLTPAVKSYDLHITVASKAPDCFQRDVILINGEFAPTLEVTQNQLLEVSLWIYGQSPTC